jgi:2-phosphoglycerate kinase
LGGAVRAILPDDPAFNPNGNRSYEDYYLQETNEKLISDTERHHNRIKPAVMRVINSHLQFAGPAVIEGWSLFPLWFDEDKNDLGKIWLVSDPDTLYARMVNDDFFTGHSEREKIIKKYALRCFWQNRRIEEEAVHTHQNIIKVGMSTTPEELLQNAMRILK